MKFNVGDNVKIVGATSLFAGQVGVVIRDMSNNRVKIQWPSGEKFSYDEEVIALVEKHKYNFIKGQSVQHSITKQFGTVLETKSTDDHQEGILCYWPKKGIKIAAFAGNLIRTEGAKMNYTTKTADQERFIIGSIYENGQMSFSSTPKQHASEPAARAEAERLALSTPSKTFVVCKIVGTVKATGVQWN